MTTLVDHVVHPGIGSGAFIIMEVHLKCPKSAFIEKIERA